MLPQVTLLAQKLFFSILIFSVFNISDISDISAQTAPATINATRIAEVDQPIQVLSASHDVDNDNLLLVGHDGVVHFLEPATGLRAIHFLT